MSDTSVKVPNMFDLTGGQIMSITNVTDWRDLSDKLTPAQVTDMGLFEHDASAYRPSPGARTVSYTHLTLPTICSV